MARLTSEELQVRLRFDYRVAMGMRCELMDVRAYATQQDALNQRNVITPHGNTAQARFYRVDYAIKTLCGKGKYKDHTEVLIDLLGGNNYPYTIPGTSVISKPIPWSPHFREGSPICIEDGIWKEDQLLGHLLIYIAQLLNFHEQMRGGYVGWNGEAQNFWRNDLKGKPITPNLRYPVLPAWVYGESTHKPVDEFIPRLVSRPVVSKAEFNPH